MQHFIRATALIFVVALFAMHNTTVHAEAEEGDWAGGWNTWKDAKVGDWIEYSITGVAGTRQEVIKVSGDNITYVHKTFDKKGKETSSNERTRTWKKIKVQGKLPYGDIDVVWKTSTLQFGDEKIECDVASWTIDGGSEMTSQEIYFSKQVPCGGVVKTTTNGKDMVWMTGYGKEGAEVKGAAGEETAPAKSKLPRFYAAVDNSAVVKISGTGRDASYQLRTVIKVEEEMTTWTVVACDKEGTPDANSAAKEILQTKEGWDKDYGSPSETGVTLKVEAGEFKCDVFKSESSGRETTEWISEGVSVKKVIKSKGKETTIELVSVRMK